MICLTIVYLLRMNDWFYSLPFSDSPHEGADLSFIIIKITTEKLTFLTKDNQSNKQTNKQSYVDYHLMH